MIYNQCRLRKSTPKGYSEVVMWVPKKYAKVDNVLWIQFGDDDDKSKGWRVEHVGIEQENPITPQQAFKRHKKKTGDSLPKVK